MVVRPGKVMSFLENNYLDLSFNTANIGHTVGIDGFLFSIAEPYESWNFYRLPNWDLLRDVAFNSKDEGILVGGVAFANGQITVVDSNYQAVKVDTFEHQMEAVAFSDDTNNSCCWLWYNFEICRWRS